MTGMQSLKECDLERGKDADSTDQPHVGSERMLKPLDLFTQRVSALLLDTEKELDARLNQVLDHPESNLWDAIAKTPRRLRPRWTKKSI